jgi:K+-transporting ATPase ATPase C chain
MVTASGSGLDPHISTDSALLQIPRIARERHLSEEEVKYLVQKHVEDRQFGFLGAPRINVLKLNLSLDKL